MHRGVRIYWEEHGSGPVILLVMGLSFTLDMWFRIAPQLASHHRVILFDNRGVGRSDVPRGPYTIATMAEDSMCVLDAAEVRQPVHLMGASMGGMIAQEAALRHPKSFCSLVLACTACGPFYRAAWPDFERSPGLRRWLMLRGELREQSLVRFLYAESTPQKHIEEDIQVRLKRPPQMRGVLNQLAGILMWSSYARLPQIRIPTLILHGEEDHVLPPENGRIIARRIPGAEYVELPQAGHILGTDQPEACIVEVSRFLSRVESDAAEQPSPAGLEPAESRA